MSAFTIIEPGIGEWRSAAIDTDGFPAAVNFHADTNLSPMDAIYFARVRKVDPTLDMAFLDMGDSIDGVLNLRRAKQLVKGRADTINACVREGEMLKVQVVAEPSSLEGKAVSVTPRPRLLGRYVVVEAGASRLNFSKDLGPKAQKKLTPLLEEFAQNAAIIVRSTAAPIDPQAVVAEARMLTDGLTRSADKPGLSFAHNPLAQALLGCPHDHTKILIEGGSVLAEAKALANKFWPDLKERLELYTGKESAFEHHGVNEAIEEALAERINLPSGGWISIAPTPALTAIDVNMGSALKGRSAGEAKLVTNMEAAMAIAYHLRFQDIGGLVVVDFIDMSAKGAARDLMRTVDLALREDPVPVQHTGISQFGLMEINRKRSGLSLRDRMQEHRMPAMRAQAEALTILREGHRVANSADTGTLVLAGPANCIAWLKRHSHLTEALAAATGRSIDFDDTQSPSAWLRSK